MQDSTDDQSGEEVSTVARLRGAVSTVIGALIAMALLMALGIWFYRLGVRDAQNVPIIRAAAEPAKTRPEDPGGLVAPHQEMESYEVTTGSSSQAAAVIASQPPAPRPEDLAMAELPPVEPEPAPVTPAPAVEQAPAVSSEPQDQTQAVLTTPTTTRAEDGQVALNDTQPAQPAPSVEPEPEPAVVTTPEPAVGGTGYAPSISPVAKPRPANIRERTVAAQEAEARNASDLAARAASSKVQVQLAADPSEAAIRLRWQKIRKANDDLLRNRALSVQTTVSGGTTFYRLRVGPFKDAAEARAVCQALKGRGQDCIVARNS